MQTITTKYHGKINFIKTWVDGNIHVGLTDTGDYRHIGGPVVANKSDLNVITDINHLNAAHDWLEDTYNKKPAIEPAPILPKGFGVEPVGIPGDKGPDKDPFTEKLRKVLPKGKLTDVKVCPICKKETMGAMGLKSHMRTHAGDINVDANIVDENERDVVEIVE